jgi:CDGSH-type Zn-finger protein
MTSEQPPPRDGAGPGPRPGPPPGRAAAAAAAAAPPPAPGITVSRDGPYIVRGLPVSRRREVISEHGEPMTWRTGVRFETGAVVALCRCGQSANKPFCDGTHARAGFDGTEVAVQGSYAERATPYEGEGIVVHDDRALCVHAGFCGNRVSNVWKLVGGGTTADSVVRAQVMAMIERCPSGALTFRLPGDEDDIEPELPAAVGVIDDGPLAVTGGVRVERSDGELLEPRNRMTLCRCGQSGNKPLCDGSHKSAGFVDS